MLWTREDAEIWRDQMLRQVSHEAALLHHIAWSFVGSEETDGYLSALNLETLCAIWRLPAEAAAELVSVGKWQQGPGGYLLPEFLHQNPTHEAYQSQKVRRTEAGRQGGRRSGETRRRKAAQREANAQASASISAPEPPGDEANAEANAQANAEANAQAKSNHGHGHGHGYDYVHGDEGGRLAAASAETAGPPARRPPDPSVHHRQDVVAAINILEAEFSEWLYEQMAAVFRDYPDPAFVLGQARLCARKHNEDGDPIRSPAKLLRAWVHHAWGERRQAAASTGTAESEEERWTRAKNNPVLMAHRARAAQYAARSRDSKQPVSTPAD